MFVIVVLALAWTGCKSDVEKVAQRVCDCSEPGMEFQEKLMEAGTDQDQMQQLLAEYEEVMDEMIACQDEIMEDYAEEFEDDDFNHDVADAMFDVCPDIAKQIQMPVGPAGDAGTDQQ